MNPYYFWSLWAFDTLIALVVLYFFFLGITDGSISSFNIGIWLLLLAGVALVLGGGWWLYSIHRYLLAKLLLWVMAAPGLIYALFLLIVVIGKPRWN